jgi:predicted double-glycine peptidase
MFLRYNNGVLTNILTNFINRGVSFITACAIFLIGFPAGVTADNTQSIYLRETAFRIEILKERIAELRAELSFLQYTKSTSLLLNTNTTDKPTEVPFYSQFTDITKPGWQKIGCGIASIAMLIDYYSDENINVDDLLEKGIANDAYLQDAGWIHSGLIALSNEYGLDGKSISLSYLNKDDALTELKGVVAEGPVMVSVHYTFEPSNPIPHLVIINDIRDGHVHYNDPAEQAGNGTLTFEQFKRGWKQRYIVVRPVHS